MNGVHPPPLFFFSRLQASKGTQRYPVLRGDVKGLAQEKEDTECHPMHHRNQLLVLFPQGRRPGETRYGKARSAAGSASIERFVASSELNQALSVYLANAVGSRVWAKSLQTMSRRAMATLKSVSTTLKPSSMSWSSSGVPANFHAARLRAQDRAGAGTMQHLKNLHQRRHLWRDRVQQRLMTTWACFHQFRSRPCRTRHPDAAR